MALESPVAIVDLAERGRRADGAFGIDTDTSVAVHSVQWLAEQLDDAPTALLLPNAAKA